MSTLFLILCLTKLYQGVEALLKELVKISTDLFIDSLIEICKLSNVSHPNFCTCIAKELSLNRCHPALG